MEKKPPLLLVLLLGFVAGFVAGANLVLTLAESSFEVGGCAAAFAAGATGAEADDAAFVSALLRPKKPNWRVCSDRPQRNC